MRFGTGSRRFIVASLALASVAVILTACGRDRVSMAFMPVGRTYPAATVQSLDKFDILFVIDNSGSMDLEQNSLAYNMSQFMNSFISRGYDFKIAVVGTDAYKTGLAGFQSVGTTTGVNLPVGTAQPRNIGCINDLDIYQGAPAGFSLVATSCLANTPVVTSSSGTTQQIIDTVIANSIVGTNGDGTERGLSSMVYALKLAAAPNNTFLRADSFLSVIIISDQEDTSDTNPVSCYLDGTGGCAAQTNFAAGYNSATYNLNAITGTSGTSRRYNVNGIYFDGTTTASPSCAGEDGTADVRYAQAAAATNGVSAALCGGFANSLSSISAQITTLATQFYLSRIPNTATIYVAFDGVVVPNNATNGWTYDGTSNSILFHGTYTPSASTNIFIDFVPAQ